jgi:hypothetical protein
MKSLSLPLCIIAIATVLFSCKKETVPGSQTNKQDESAASNVAFIKNALSYDTTIKGKWVGAYQLNAGPSHQLFKDESFINSGVAQIPKPDVYSWYYTGFYLRIPAGKNLNGDAIRIEARVNNNNSFSNTPYSYGRHSSVALYGSTDTAWCAMNDPERSDALTYCRYGFGGVVTQYINAFLFSQQDWYTLGMETKDQNINFSKDGNQIYTVGYNGHANVGGLKAIAVYFYGSGKVDWVKLYDSQTNELLMQEDFNKDNKSRVIWF